MTETRLSDVIVPEVFNPNVTERTSEKVALWQSGVISSMTDVPIGMGKTIEMPFYQDLSGADNVWNDTDDITLNKIGMAQDTAVVLTREKAFGSTDLSAALGQDDPMNAISGLVASYWARRYQSALISTLNGAFGALSATNVHDISAATGTASDIDGESFVDATQKMGDHSEAITDMVVHSAVEASLRKQDLITFIPDSEGKLTIRSFQGRRVHIDDGCPVTSGGAYTTYLFGQGAVGWVEEGVPNANEPYRHPEKSGGTDALYTRRKFVMHPRGIRWTPGSGVPASATPSNAELSGANWTRVWEPQNIRIVQFKHTIA